ncbi:hypothetical protein CcaverHIS002_0600270 [Cutaneotrichosporon cavernicola]|uniref:Major facilitator superfamily (MFS) profile domain-containing protein n=1 Tax=Cutaneotrichosporon cavernicola TaxID=279322 RepID=A0AA48L5N9_9TREE|nr:uncharacterized protein CcaverHIS019_0500360 [Cutaneotrichosporon cavernicola]BEI85740.1 hypothetical protein CcaverHIS002_0600270 [Cutaneotrichosporon cavernicola]BEI92408.1 hypothetical protein CcaverHIS019_0500360 [Cutaneotrichosporon cavernicola]BEJ00181.1 hypothetical protein CcaverHIS631_0500380 [Cutaneotrichosporon cavernicola]BEJ07952.1 hypothetical protein CcaverHIS641_0500370 [Cutaneotrichosporon cavernicola]
MSTSIHPSQPPSIKTPESIELPTSIETPESIELSTLSRLSSRADEPPLASTASTASPPKPTTLRQVAICVASFMCIFTTCGGVFSFGVYQELYQRMSEEPNTPFTGASPAAIDIIGTLSAAFMTIGAPIANAWTKRFSPRVAVLIGAGLSFAAAMLASYSQHLWQFILTQGLLMGLGTCFSYMPAATVAPMWFGRRRGLAMGIILSGTGVGGLVWAPVMHALNENLGFRNALRISGAVTTTLVAVGAFILDWDPVSKARIDAEKARLASRPRHSLRSLWDIPLVDMRIAKTGKFGGQLLATFLQSAAYYTPVFFFSAYARTLGYSSRQGANFIAINNACNALGKIFLGILADRFGHINMLLLTTAISAVASFVFWMPSTLLGGHDLVTGRGLFVTYSIMYGTFASAYVSLFPAALVEIFGPHNFASVNGILYMARGFGTLAGTPSAGATVHSGSHTAGPSAYFGMATLISALLLAASVGVVWVRWENKRAPMWKA